MKSSKEALKAFCVFYNARKDPATRAGLLSWLRDGVSQYEIASDVAEWVHDFNMGSRPLHIHDDDMMLLSQKVIEAFSVNFQ